MKISSEQNRFYNALLNEIRPSIKPDMNHDQFRAYVKEIDPLFPIDDYGDPISMKDIEPHDWKVHVEFLLTMCERRGVDLSRVSNEHKKFIRTKSIKASVVGGFEEVDDCIIARVVCSSCGAATLRQLTQDRYDEIVRITNGEAEEVKDPTIESFECIDCVTIMIDNGKYKLRGDNNARHD